MLLTRIRSRENGNTIQHNLCGIATVESVDSIGCPLHLPKSKVQFLQFGVVTLILLISPKFIFAQLPDLGTADSFVLFTSAGALSNAGISIITGNIGANDGAITGFETATVNGSIHSEDSVTAQCSIDVQAAYNELSLTPATDVDHAAAFGGGETLFAGVYAIAAAGSLGGSLTLDAEDDPDAVFIFKFGAAFTTTACSVILINGATACNVFWIAEGAIAMAAATDIKGTIIANNGAISLGAGSLLEGRMLTTAGAASVLSVTIALPICVAPEPTADAGPSADTICDNADYTTSGTATNGTILWTTSGDGVFEDDTLEAAVYTPGSNDISNSTVTLTMIVTGIDSSASDTVVLTIAPVATAVAGLAIDNVCYNTDYTASATATNGTILWTTSGDGTFEDAMIEDAVYAPGSNDQSNGTVTLNMAVTGICNSVSDDVVLTIAPEATADAGLSTDNVCFNADYTASATAANGTILWTTSGDGTFGDATIEDAVYTFGETDNSNGAVTLTMTVTGICNTDVDNIGLSIDPFCPIPPCTEVIDLSAAYFAHDPHQQDFHAGMKVIADGIITSANMENITFRAGTEVELRPVFEVQQGAILTIYIEPCVLPPTSSK